MADNQLFGTSTRKYSLASISARPQARITTADDINTLLGTVAKTTDDVVKIIEDKQSVELNKKYNDLQVAYNESMTSAGEDLGKQTEAYDTFYNQTKSLMNTTNVSEKVKARFNAVALNDISRIRSKHDAIRNIYNENLFYDDIATDAMTFKSLTAKQKKNWYLEKQTVGKLRNLQPNQISEQIIKAMYNTNRALITKDTDLATLETMKSDIEAIAEVDDKVKGKPYYSEALQGMESYINNKKSAMESTLLQELSYGGYDTKTQLALVKEATYLTNDKRTAYNQMIKNKDYNQKLEISAGNWSAVMNNFDIGMDTLKVMGKNRMKLDPKYTEEMYQSDLFNANKARKAYQRTQDTYNRTEQKNMALEKLNMIKSYGSYDVEPSVVNNLILTATGDGALSQENISFARRYNIGYEATTQGFVDSFENYKNRPNGLVDNDASFYKELATNFVSNKAAEMFDSGNVVTLGGIISKTRQVGKVKNIISTALDGSVVETTDDITKLEQGISKTGVILASNVDKIDAILDKDSKKRFLLYSNFMLSNGNKLTKPFIDKVEKFIETPEYKNFKETSTKGQESIKYFTDNWKGESMATFGYDKETYSTLKEFGMSDKEALDAINSRYKVAKGDNYSLVGIDPQDPMYEDIDNTIKKLSTQITENTKDAFFTVGSDGMLWLGSKDYPAQTNLGIPLKTTRDADGNYIQIGLKDTLALLDRLSEANGQQTFLGSKQGYQNLRQVKSFMRELLVDLPTVAINQLIAGDTFYQRAVKDIGKKASKGLKSLGKEVEREINRFDSFFGIKRNK